MSQFPCIRSPGTDRLVPLLRISTGWNRGVSRADDLIWSSRSSSEIFQAMGRIHFLVFVGVRLPFSFWPLGTCSASWGLLYVLATWPSYLCQLTSSQQENLSSLLRWTLTQSNLITGVEILFYPQVSSALKGRDLHRVCIWGVGILRPS